VHKNRFSLRFGSVLIECACVSASPYLSPSLSSGPTAISFSPQRENWGNACAFVFDYVYYIFCTPHRKKHDEMLLLKTRNKYKWLQEIYKINEVTKIKEKLYISRYTKRKVLWRNTQKRNSIWCLWNFQWCCETEKYERSKSYRYSLLPLFAVLAC